MGTALQPAPLSSPPPQSSTFSVRMSFLFPIFQAVDESEIRQNYHQECETLVNKQINQHFHASYVYTALANFFTQVDQALPGFACYFKTLEVASKARQSLVNLGEEVCQGSVDIAGMEMLVDLLVDQSLTLRMIILADFRLINSLEDREEERHPDREGGGLRRWTGQWGWLQGSPH